MRRRSLKSIGDDAMQKEYIEGSKAGHNFKVLAAAVFQAKKTTVPAKAKKKAVRRKASGKDKA
jgi:hypothetical protein